jgi:hypothetical protein
VREQTLSVDLTTVLTKYPDRKAVGVRVNDQVVYSPQN